MPDNTTESAHFGRWLGVGLLVLVLDQISKQLVATQMYPGQVIEVLPFLNLVLVFNQGAAFSFLADAGGWQRHLFSLLAAGAALVILYLLRKPGIRPLTAFALALVLGGALGNLVDRLHQGAVTDFIDAYWNAYHWPAFNLADSAITLGAVLLILEGFLKPQSDPKITGDSPKNPRQQTEKPL